MYTDQKNHQFRIGFIKMYVNEDKNIFRSFSRFNSILTITARRIRYISGIAEKVIQYSG
jgi:hypothetical protein